MSEMNILVVEDEQAIRKGIEKAIAQLNDGFRVLSTADDGETALQWLETAKVLPDLIITDIYMQFMDGIELIEQVNRRYPGIPCAILSGHEDFRLAQKAIDLKVCRYITKPVQPAELHGILCAIREDIMKARLRFASQQHAGKPSRANTESYVREKLLSDLLEGKLLSMAELKENADCFNFPLDGEYFGGVVRLKKSEPELSQRDLLLYCTGTKHLFSETVLGNVKGFVLIKDERTLVFGIQPADSNSCDSIQNFALLADKVLGIPVATAVGTVVRGIVRIPQSVSQAYDLLEAHSLGEPSYPLEEEQKFRMALGTGRTEEALLSARQFLRMLMAGNEGDAHALQGFYKLAVSVEKLFQELGLQCPALPQLHRHSMAVAAKRMQRWLEACVISRGTVTKTGAASDVVEKVAAYIEQHYHDYSLTLQSLADVVSLHPNYLTQTFRKQTGFSCMQYLAKTRMEKAKQLLNNTDLKISEIAEKVGYENPLYFSSYFKKWVGKNPSDYKEESGSYA